MCELLHTCPTKKQRRGRAATKDDYAAVTDRSDVHVGESICPLMWISMSAFGGINAHLGGPARSGSLLSTVSLRQARLT
jgi:hypothetical protein